MNTLQWTPRALRQLAKIKDKPTRQHVYAESQVLADFPHCPNVKKLVNHPHSYRLRIGHYRVFFEFDGDVHIVSIEAVKKRDESTY